MRRMAHILSGSPLFRKARRLTKGSVCHKLKFMRPLIAFISLCSLGLADYCPETALSFDAYGHVRPQWSPDGGWIACQRADGTNHLQIYKLPVNGDPQVALTSTLYHHEYPQWSPDGNWLVFQRRDGSGTFLRR